MKKLFLFTLHTLAASQLSCAQAESSTTVKAIAAALCEAGHPHKALVQDSVNVSFECQASNQITQKEANAHEALNKLVFKIDDPTKHTAAQMALTKPYYETFLTSLRNEKDVVVSAYTHGISPDSMQLVGGLFGTKLKGPNEKLGLTKGQAIFQINCIYVADDAQRRHIGTKMVEKLQCYTRNLPIVLFLKTTNTVGRRFWNSQKEFHLVTDPEHPTGEGAQMGWNLLTAHCPKPPYAQEDIVTYYSPNGAHS